MVTKKNKKNKGIVHESTCIIGLILFDFKIKKNTWVSNYKKNYNFCSLYKVMLVY